MMQRTVLVEGPQSGGFNRDGDEFPEWTVAIVDEDGETVGKFYRVRSYAGAIDLGQKMARDRRLPLDIDAGPD